MDKEQEYLKHCRYYKAEDGNPYTDFPMRWFWDMERVYVVRGGGFPEKYDYYKRMGGKDFPGVPVGLLMVMFTSWGKVGYLEVGKLGNFCKLVEEYLAKAKDRFPEDKIPGQ